VQAAAVPIIQRPTREEEMVDHDKSFIRFTIVAAIVSASMMALASLLYLYMHW